MLGAILRRLNGSCETDKIWCEERSFWNVAGRSAREEENEGGRGRWRCSCRRSGVERSGEPKLLTTERVGRSRWLSSREVEVSAKVNAERATEAVAMKGVRVVSL